MMNIPKLPQHKLITYQVSLRLLGGGDEVPHC